MKAAAYHKNLAQRYAMEAGCAVLFPDYRLTPKNPFPAQIQDCVQAYRWLLKKYHPKKIAVGGDSAGAALAAGVALYTLKKGLRVPDAAMLIYPMLDSRMSTESMKKYTDTPLWNSVLNREAWMLYAGEKNLHNPLASPMEAKDLRGFPQTYLETAEYDCLHDEGITFAHRLEKSGVLVDLNETQRTIHGYDIAEDSGYVKAQVCRRISYLNEIYGSDKTPLLRKYPDWTDKVTSSNHSIYKGCSRG
ncbi:MAG: alpha/beta hydrolase [Clostridiales bacterium]|nr:alpha/beta hydrolase [Clostridiales bacterium]